MATARTCSREDPKPADATGAWWHADAVEITPREHATPGRREWLCPVCGERWETDWQNRPVITTADAAQRMVARWADIHASAVDWWLAKRPAGWTEQRHCEQWWEGCATKAERALAHAIAGWVAFPGVVGDTREVE